MTPTTPQAGASTPTIPFGRILRLGSVGRDVQGIKRALARAGGTNAPALGTQTLGKTAVAALRALQRRHGLTADGEYGPRTHAKLTPHFDAYTVLLYTGHPPVKPGPSLQLPATFTPTHQTDGLPGYPAIDMFAAPDTVVLAPAEGQITRCSGRNPNLGGPPGGPYGWSIYLTAAHGVYFLTHFATRYVTEGVTVKRGERLGTVCDAKVAGMASSLSHIHAGLRQL